MFFCKQQLRRNRKAACEHTHTAGLAGLPRMRPEPVADPTAHRKEPQRKARRQNNCVNLPPLLTLQTSGPCVCHL